MEVDNLDLTQEQKVLIVIYTFIFLFSFMFLILAYHPSNRDVGETIKNKLRTGAKEITFNDVDRAFEKNTVYEGKWNKIDRNQAAYSNNYVSTNEGKFEMKMQSLYTVTTDYKYNFQLVIFNCEYIDDGTITYQFTINMQNFNFQLNKHSELTIFLNDNRTNQVKYYQKNILIEIQSGSWNLTALNFSFSLQADQSLDIHMVVDMLDTRLSMHLIRQDHKILKIMIFAVIMLAAYSLPFTALYNYSCFDDNASNYSFITLYVTSIWDAVLIIVFIIYTMKVQEILYIYIMIFFTIGFFITNYRHSFMVLIYKTIFDNQNIRNMTCKFSILHYGSLLMAYPILCFFNFNWIFFIAISCIVFPQIYLNALRRIKPDPLSPYYSQYIFGRFIILFYLKCFPLNVFGFKPDYLLGIICLTLISFQFILLYIQKHYGSEKIIPTFLRDKLFNYLLLYQFNDQEAQLDAQCSICMTSLNMDASYNLNELQSAPTFKLVRTPCKHKYHSLCLMVWMKIKMQCPLCRYKLPPFE